MNILILAAGYATRLYPLTENMPKSLLRVAEKVIIEWLLDALLPYSSSQSISIVTNKKFFSTFESWNDDYAKRSRRNNIIILNDGSMCENDRLGAIGDINFYLNQSNNINDDLLVIAGDNLFSQSLSHFIQVSQNQDYLTTLATYNIGNFKDISRYNYIQTNELGIITDFKEKPKHQIKKVNNIGIALYFYRKEVFPLIKNYINAGNNADQPGLLIQWLYPQIAIRTSEIKGVWFDIGSKESLEVANRVFQENQYQFHG